jgi:hypothetical protein
MTPTNPTDTYRTARFTNSGKQCNARHCIAQRHGLNGYCRAHYEAARRFGSPNAKPLKRIAWVPYRVAVRDLFNLNAQHRGLVDAVAYLTEWMAKGSSNAHAYKGAQEMRRLSEHGISARQVLEEVCAVQMYLAANPCALPDDLSRDFALARAVFALAPMPTKTSWDSGKPKTYRGRATGASLRYVGRHLREGLAGIAAQAHLGVEARAKATAMSQARIEEARRTPFAIR